MTRFHFGASPGRTTLCLTIAQDRKRDAKEEKLRARATENCRGTSSSGLWCSRRNGISGVRVIEWLRGPGWIRTNDHGIISPFYASLEEWGSKVPAVNSQLLRH